MKDKLCARCLHFYCCGLNQITDQCPIIVPVPNILTAQRPLYEDNPLTKPSPFFEGTHYPFDDEHFGKGTEWILALVLSVPDPLLRFNALDIIYSLSASFEVQGMLYHFAEGVTTCWKRKYLLEKSCQWASIIWLWTIFLDFVSWCLLPNEKNCGDLSTIELWETY